VFLSAKTVEKTVALVEEEMISVMDLKETKKRLKKGFLDESILLSYYEKSKLQKKDSLLLEFLVYEIILDILASSIEIEDDQVRKEVENHRQKKKLSKKAFSRFLVRNGFTASSYKEFLKKSILRKLLVQKEVIEKIRISDQDINEYALQKTGTPLFSSFEYELEYLFFPLTPKGKKVAQNVYQGLKNDPLLFENWEPNNPSEKKETLKNIKLFAMQPTVRKSVEKLSIGQTSAVLSLPNGYHIFKVVWKAPVITTKNKKLKERFSLELFQELFKKKLKSWLEEKKRNFVVKINV